MALKGDRRYCRIYGIVALALMLSACGGGDDETSTPGGGSTPAGMIGAAGGTITGPNSAQVLVPAGALTQNTSIVIAQSSTGAPPLPSGVTALGEMYAFTPHGTTFATPVTITIPFDPALVPANTTPVLYKTTAGEAGWEVVSGAIVNGATMTAPVSSFSFAVIAAPPRAEQAAPPHRRWRFTGIRADDDEITREEGFDEDGRVVFDDHEFGALTIAPLDHSGIAHGEVFANETGNTYWLGLTAPVGNTAEAASLIGGIVEFEQVQFYRKSEANATLRFLITQAILEGYDLNGAEPRYSTCPWGIGSAEPSECLDELISAVELQIVVIALGTDIEAPVFTLHQAHQGVVQMSGWQENWTGVVAVNADRSSWYARSMEGDEQNVPVTAIFREDHFDLIEDAGPVATFRSHATMQLRQPRPVEIDISSLPVGAYFAVETTARAFAHNRRARESFALAYLRDPASSNGLSWEASGLETVPAVEFTGPLVIEEPACEGISAAAGELQFSNAAYTLPEFKHSSRRVLITRTGGSEGRVIARVETSDGTAIAGTHYEPVAHTIVFGDGDDVPRAIEIPMINDAVFGGPNTINLTLSAEGACANIGAQSSAVVTILDDETPAPATYTVGGTVVGLAGSGLVLEDAITGLTGVPANGSFTIDYRYPNGGSYDVRVRTQPSNPIQSCTVANASGTINSANVANIVVTCTTPQASGALDESFGEDGRVTVDVASSAGARAMALQSDGKILAVSGLQLLRFNANGSLDTTFGANGVVPIVFNSGLGDEAYAVAVQADGRIVVAGQTRVGTQDDFAIARFNTDGSPDTSFGTAGRTSVPVYVDGPTTNPPLGQLVGSTDRAYKVLPLADGDLLIAGHARFSVFDSSGALDRSGNSYAVVRLNSDGSIDTSFNGNGRATISPNGVDAALAYAADVDVDGRILIGGRYGTATSDSDIGIARFNQNGSLDTTFGPSDFGYTTHNLYGSSDELRDLELLPDGRIVVAAYATPSAPTPTTRFTVAIFTPDGAAQVATSTPIGNGPELSPALAVQADGKIVLVGQAQNAAGTNIDFGIVRYNADLTIDETFGAGGIVTVDFFGSTDAANDVLIQPDGRIVVGGVVRNGSSWDLGLVRIAQ